MGAVRSQASAIAFGQAVGALMASERHRRLRLRDLEERLIPPLVLGQFMTAVAPVPNRPGETAPVALVVWALVSDEVDRRLQREAAFPLTVGREEWRSGPHLWIVDIAGAPETVRRMLGDLAGKLPAGVMPKLPPNGL
jgi:hemolysin-activating ACP:hemolysin acyltransferase